MKILLMSSTYPEPNVTVARKVLRKVYLNSFLFLFGMGGYTVFCCLGHSEK